MHKHTFVTGLLASILIVAACAYWSLPASAAYPASCRYPRDDCGYFIGRNEPEPYDFVFACGLYDFSKAAFETDIINYSNGVVPASQMPPNCAPNLGLSQYETGADFIILTMLGYPAGTPKSTATNAAVQADWLTRVDYYQSQGWINFNYTIPSSGAEWCINTANQIASPDIAQLNDCVYGQKAIQFLNPTNGKHYVIKQECGNPIGDLSALSQSPTYKCGNFNPSPGLIQPNQNFTVTIDDTYTNGPPVYTNFQLTIALSPPYNNVNARPVTKSGSTLSYKTITLRAPPTAGDYDASWQLYNGGTPLGPVCSGTLSVKDLPYFSVYNGDVSTGGDFTGAGFPGCSTNGGTLASWYDSSGVHAGASTLLSDLSTGTINGFASSQSTGAGPPGGGGDALTFANTGGITGTSPSAAFGGSYGGSQCLFTPTMPPGAANLGSGTGSIDTAPLTTGAFQYTRAGGYQLGAAGTPNGKVGVSDNLAIYVSGNVYIGSDVIYDTDAGGTWAIRPDGSTDIPSFVLVAVGGNIYIDPGVKELDGIYVAEAKSGAGGTIYTCGSAFAPSTAPSLYTCNGQLTVHGSFVADRVNLMRTLGTLDDATPGESPWSGTRPCTNGANSSVCAAEVFNFSPELDLSQPQIQPPNNGAIDYDDIATLPPVL